MLHPAIGKNRYCGPGALAVLTGRSTDDTAKLLRDVSGKRAIMRIHHRFMLRALDMLGLRYSGWAGVYRKPLRQFTVHPTAHGIYLVVITGHYCVLDTRTMEVCDNLTIYPLPIDRYRFAGKHVQNAWRVF